MLSSLVNQVLTDPRPLKIHTLRDPLCPNCPYKAIRSRGVQSGRLQPYCKQCASDKSKANYENKTNDKEK